MDSCAKMPVSVSLQAFCRDSFLGLLPQGGWEEEGNQEEPVQPDASQSLNPWVPI